MARVLVVDDLSDMRAVSATLLRHAGHEVDEAASGPEALLKILQNPPDLVFLDLSMPGMDGFAVLRAIRHQWGAQVRVVILSALDDEATLGRAKALGADGFVVKGLRGIDEMLESVPASAPFLRPRNGTEPADRVQEATGFRDVDAQFSAERIEHD